ncbi:MAG: hypothetical protein ACM3X9_10720 [Bacillota bacterium]
MAKLTKNQYESNKNQNQEEIARDFTPATDQEYAEDYSYNPPAKGMNKKQQQLKK